MFASSRAGVELAAVAAAVLAHALVSRRIHGSPLSPAILFVGIGLLIGTEGAGIIESVDAHTLRTLAEVTLALVLFTDAASLRTRLLRREATIPLRLLLVGLPLTIVAGTLAGLPLLGGLTMLEVAVVAVLLAPTDASLGEPVVTDARLPSRLRQGLNVESGLNDGICLPLLLGAIALAEMDEAPGFDGDILVDLVTQLAVAVVAGAVIAAAAAWALGWSERRRWITAGSVQVVPPAVVALAYTITVEFDGSGFVAAFVAGLVYRVVLGEAEAHTSVRLAEEVGGVLSAATFVLFGAVVVGPLLEEVDAATILYAVLSLTVVRMVPVALSLAGTGETWATRAFAGWFGPRGLASIVFALTVVEESDLTGTPTIVVVTVTTVVLSVLAHGLSAPALTARYVRGSRGSDPASPAPEP